MTKQSQSHKRKREIGDIIGVIVYTLFALIYIGLGVAGVILKVTGAYSWDAADASSVTGGSAVALGVVYIIFGMFVLAVVITICVSARRKPRDYSNVGRDNEQDGENSDESKRI